MHQYAAGRPDDKDAEELRELRLMRRGMSGTGNQQGKPENSGCQEMHFLYAVCCQVSKVRVQSKWRNGSCCSAGN